jgi:hypothetical protein
MPHPDVGESGYVTISLDERNKCEACGVTSLSGCTVSTARVFLWQPVDALIGERLQERLR